MGIYIEDEDEIQEPKKKQTIKKAISKNQKIKNKENAAGGGNNNIHSKKPR